MLGSDRTDGVECGIKYRLNTTESLLNDLLPLRDLTLLLVNLDLYLVDALLLIGGLGHVILDLHQRLIGLTLLRLQQLLRLLHLRGDAVDIFLGLIQLGHTIL